MKKKETVKVEEVIATKKTWTAAMKLRIGDTLESKTGKVFRVTRIEVKNLRTIVLLDDDLEVDFENYHQLHVNRKIE